MSEPAPAREAETATTREPATAVLATRSVIGGILMGLANLVPGISGGTMLLAVGIYPQFINGIAEVTTFRFRKRTILTLGCVVIAAVAAIVALAGPVSELVVHQRWVMYSLFIGLTLGGVPIVWRMIGRFDAPVLIATSIGVAIMAAMTFWTPGGDGAAGHDGHPYLLYFIAGLAGASAMVLPGISGGYLLLLLGQYVTILSAVALAREGVSDRDMSKLTEAMHVIVPVGVGVLVGVVGISNLLKVLLARYERPTLGVLLGLLLGAVIGLYPFQHPVAPAAGDLYRDQPVAIVDGVPVVEATGKLIEPKDFPTERFTPSGMQIGSALGLICAGFAVSTVIALLGRTKE